jgi:phosphoribosylformylglycinamidine synthase PurS subunit
MRAKVYVTPRPEVLDPQGEAVKRGLLGLGFAEIVGVRVGKYLEIELETNDRALAEQRVHEMCVALLANPVVEEYRFEVEP